MQILPEFQKEYNSKVDLGKKYLNNKKVIVSGLVKNSEAKIVSCLNQLSNIADNSSALSCFLYENNSTDNTKEILNTYSETNNKYDNFNFYSEDISLPNIPHGRSSNRLKVLSYARNICKDFIKNTYLDYDYVVVVDMDFVSISLDGIYNSFGWFAQQQEQIDAMAGFSFITVQRPNPDNPSLIENHLSNYDSWAYRHNWWEDLTKRFMLDNKTQAFTFDPMLWFSAWTPLVGACPIRVNSAFGGCCIYKTNQYVSGQYEDYDCEHVTFHKSLYFDSNFNLYVNPSQIMMLN